MDDASQFPQAGKATGPVGDAVQASNVDGSVEGAVHEGKSGGIALHAARPTDQSLTPIQAHHAGSEVAAVAAHHIQHAGTGRQAIEERVHVGPGSVSGGVKAAGDGVPCLELVGHGGPRVGTLKNVPGGRNACKPSRTAGC